MSTIVRFEAVDYVDYAPHEHANPVPLGVSRFVGVQNTLLATYIYKLAEFNSKDIIEWARERIEQEYGFYETELSFNDLEDEQLVKLTPESRKFLTELRTLMKDEGNLVYRVSVY